MISAPRMTPLAMPTRVPTPETSVVRTPPCTVGAIDVTAPWTASIVAWLTPRAACASSAAASTESPIWSS